MIGQSQSRTDFTSAYRRRVVDDELDVLLPALPALLLDGPKGVGKTATAIPRCVTVRRLDEPAQRAIIEADPRIVADDEEPILLDEWQRVPAVFDAIRRLVDQNPRPHRFLLTGSAPTKATHSGAGRITSLRMRPLSLFERYETRHYVSMQGLLDGTATVEGHCSFQLKDYVEETVSGGFPGLRHLSGVPLRRQLDGYLERIVDHDIPEAGYAVRRPQMVRALLMAYAAAIATTTSWEKIRDAATGGSGANPSRGAIHSHVELLTYLRILDPIEAWSPSNNHLGRLMTSPKHYLADPALAARLVKKSATQLLQGEESRITMPRDGTYLGALFESLVALSIRTYAQRCEARVFYLRSAGGRHKIDFIVEADTGILAIEAKLSASVNDYDVRHLLWLRQELGEECLGLVVIGTGPEAYTRADGIVVIPLGLLGP